jgi:hypothetical protein
MTADPTTPYRRKATPLDDALRALVTEAVREAVRAEVVAILANRQARAGDAEYVSVAEACARAGLSDTTVRRLLARHGKAIRTLHTGGALRLSWVDLQQVTATAPRLTR